MRLIDGHRFLQKQNQKAHTQIMFNFVDGLKAEEKKALRLLALVIL